MEKTILPGYVLKPTYKKTAIQGVTCYLPAIDEYNLTGRKTGTSVLDGDPLIFKSDAIKYAQLYLNNL